MKRSREDEASLFREAMRDVKPLGSRGRPDEQQKKVRAPSSQATAPGSRSLRRATRIARGVEPLAVQGSSPSRALLRDLRRGRLRVQDELDLHGLNAARAAIVLGEFLDDALARRLSCVRIVHGKGLHSGAEGPVLRHLVEATLRRMPDVAAFTAAPVGAGGTGAVHVLLRR